MWPDWVSNPGPLTYESGALPTMLRGPALLLVKCNTLRSFTGIDTIICRDVSYLMTAVFMSHKSCWQV